jgi:hypothetical protein
MSYLAIITYKLDKREPAYLKIDGNVSFTDQMVKDIAAELKKQRVLNLNHADKVFIVENGNLGTPLVTRFFSEKQLRSI